VGWACGGADCGDSGGARGVGGKSRPRVASRRTPHFLSKRPQKSAQKRPFSCGGHGIREGRLVLGPVQQLTGWRLRSTERQRPQLNKFRWAGLFPWRFVGNAGGDNEIFPSAGPSLRLQAFHLPSSAGVCNNQAVSLAHRHRRQERSSQTRPLSNALTVRNHTDSTRMP